MPPHLSFFFGCQWPRLEALADNFKYSPRELANKSALLPRVASLALRVNAIQKPNHHIYPIIPAALRSA
jgi:hypothetical protein